MKKLMKKFDREMTRFYVKAKVLLADKSGAFMEDGFGWAIVVVIAGIVLTFLTLFFSDTIFPGVTNKAKEIFG